MAQLLIKTRFLIPLADNDGELFIPADFDSLRDRILDAGLAGVTRIPEVTDGWWRDEDGRLYFDRCHQYEVGLNSWWQLPGLLSIIDWARGHFRQEALYFEVNGLPEIR